VKPNEAEDIIALIKGSFPAHRLDATDKDVWMASLAPLDAELAFKAVMRGREEWPAFPSWARFKEAYRLQDRLRAAESDSLNKLPPPKVGTTYKLEQWIRRWAVARYLFKRFDREQDMRPFPEQAAYVDPLTKEWMPDDEWVKEAERISDADVWANIR
jgi:hypothetical protein